MNYFMFGKGSPQLTPKVDASTIDVLKYLIVKQEEEKQVKSVKQKVK